MSEYVLDLGCFESESIDDSLREEIVRCRDCTHFDPTAKNGICHRSEFLPMWAEPDGFCAWGKRKEGE